MANSQKIQGFSIPVNMYADNTTIYLSKKDRYLDLEDILKDWCLASGAKFNLEKTEILPIGSKTHQEQVVQQRKLHPQDEAWNDLVHIAKDEHATSWEPILEKIESNLKRWNMCHPSLDGKHLITQMIMGGMTQFMTKAQGMPKSIEAAITKKIRTFIWNNRKSPPISLASLERPVSEGGLGLLNICARNEAIDITWVQAFMNLSESRPSWAFVTDILINSLKPCNTKGHSNFNTLLTSWEPPTRGPRAN
ncbi:hypothetical protein BDR04DRAFT_1131022 [Suillus decipiens]|nr:hypothetical protein BDR04DRAFT_1131022 [Suillus decipiens]